jgi:hypothetical protein
MTEPNCKGFERFTTAEEGSLCCKWTKHLSPTAYGYSMRIKQIHSDKEGVILLLLKQPCRLLNKGISLKPGMKAQD